MSLKSIFCQDKAIDALQRALAAGRMPHAYIFAGPDGVGKFKTACEWAKLLLCKSELKQNGFADSCGSCDSCRLFDAGSHPDFNFVYKELLEFTRDGKYRKTPLDLPIDVVREFVIEKVSSRPALSQRRVFVIAEAEKLNASSQNALLKVLEEPPDYCLIILVCTRTEKLLPTTKSRCRIIRFGLVDEQVIVAKVKQMGIDQNQARYWARLSQGSLGQACQWARLQLAGAELYETGSQLLDRLVDYRYTQVLSVAEWLRGRISKLSGVWAELDEGTSKKDINRRAQKTAVYIVISALRDVMKLGLCAATKDIINFDRQGQIRKLADRFNPEQSSERISDCYRTLRRIESNVSDRLAFEQLLFKLAPCDIINLEKQQ